LSRHCLVGCSGRFLASVVFAVCRNGRNEFKVKQVEGVGQMNGGMPANIPSTNGEQ
jgi:hypothetical protein